MHKVGVGDGGGDAIAGPRRLVAHANVHGIQRWRGSAGGFARFLVKAEKDWISGKPVRSGICAGSLSVWG